MRKLNRRQWWTVAVVVGAGILIVILALVATGVLTPLGSSPADVNVQEVCVNWIQQRNASGVLWFGQNNYCLTGAGNNLPYSVAPGSSINIPIQVLNYDTTSHTIYYVQAFQSGSQLPIQRTLPTLPYSVASYRTNPEGIDGGLMVFVQLPDSPGATLTLNLTVSALPGG